MTQDEISYFILLYIYVQRRSHIKTGIVRNSSPPRNVADRTFMKSLECKSIVSYGKAAMYTLT